MDLLAVILRNRHELEMSGKVVGDDMLDMYVTNESGRHRIRQELNMKPQRMYELFKDIESKPERILIRITFDNGNLDYYRINPRYMPVIPKNASGVLSELVIRFLENDTQPL
jgi:hypothetical protein